MLRYTRLAPRKRHSGAIPGVWGRTGEAGLHATGGLRFNPNGRSIGPTQAAFRHSRRLMALVAARGGLYESAFHPRGILPFNGRHPCRPNFP
jgi:hypothetical protein